MMKFAGLALAAALMVLPGCGGGDEGNGGGSGDNEPTNVNQPDNERLPDWYTDREMNSERIYAWGRSAGEKVNGEESARASAQNEMAQTVNVLVQGMFKRYTSSTARGEAVMEERDTVSVLRTITNQSLSGFRINKVDKVEGIWYCRGELGLPDIKKIVRANKEQLQNVIEEVKANADDAFADLDAALDAEFNEFKKNQ